MLDLLNTVHLSSMADRWAWTLHEKLPTRMNLDARDIDVPTVLCPICGEHSETVSHLFFSCSFVSQVYVLIARCWDLEFLRLNLYIQ
ncbi:RNA-directed DNA polymerase, eukaryota, partial [Tanacetum coccineum]